MVVLNVSQPRLTLELWPYFRHNIREQLAGLYCVHKPPNWIWIWIESWVEWCCNNHFAEPCNYCPGLVHCTDYFLSADYFLNTDSFLSTGCFLSADYFLSNRWAVVLYGHQSATFLGGCGFLPPVGHPSLRCSMGGDRILLHSMLPRHSVLTWQSSVACGAVSCGGSVSLSGRRREGGSYILLCWDWVLWRLCTLVQWTSGACSPSITHWKVESGGASSSLSAALWTEGVEPHP